MFQDAMHKYYSTEQTLYILTVLFLSFGGSHDDGMVFSASKTSLPAYCW